MPLLSLVDESSTCSEAALYVCVCVCVCVCVFVWDGIDV